MVWYAHLFQNFPQLIVIHTVKGFGIVNKAEIDVFLELSCLFHDPADVGNLFSGSSAFSKTSLNNWKFRVHVLLRSSGCTCWSSREEIPHVQGKRNPSKMVGVARGHQRADTRKPYSQKTSQSNHTRTTLLSNSVKLSHAPGATQDGRVMVERSDRMWSTGDGNGKPLQYSCLENPMNSVNRTV